jgi:hypothetical protein
MDALTALLGYWQSAVTAIDSVAMTIALVVLACILAAVGGFGGWRTRLYGAIVGAMVMNAAIKAMGGSFTAALAATVVVAALAFAVGTVPFLILLVRRVRR